MSVEDDHPLSRHATQPTRAIHDRIAHDLAIAIVGGRYQPGEMLPGEERYSAEQGVSRTAYREAVRVLSAKGLVYSRTKSGTRINERLRWNILDLDVLAWMFEAGPTPEFLRDIFELRTVVEPAAAQFAAMRRDGQDISRMGHALEEMRRFGLQTSEGRAADQSFHNLILMATRNEALINLATSVTAVVAWTTRFARDERKESRDPMPDHDAVFDAILRGDPEDARLKMLALIGNASRDAGMSGA
ncbi:DNA-binding FadR family transcriptional regulator [Novosphingobium sp. PhB57]|jgi:DNA-binding FadR family transcriptional regulator|uniref:FadR/GntR family transcriptional regulator n=1 Tax=unclassified Novosphingobium TaxID=2644732 RepID=UPI00104373E3|nr:MULTISPECIES: FadR/GntR family transcriptional regulator [unclassified Novosphingobium]TCU57956.1 DNA-binding FadR family transcriptional regulator [Novosphingobium sp. PhB57]TDW64450.1 GntR family transcriptional regulator [Novosphingobium sp. PhB55]